MKNTIGGNANFESFWLTKRIHISRPHVLRKDSKLESTEIAIALKFAKVKKHSFNSCEIAGGEVHDDSNHLMVLENDLSHEEQSAKKTKMKAAPGDLSAPKWPGELEVASQPDKLTLFEAARVKYVATCVLSDHVPTPLHEAFDVLLVPTLRRWLGMPLSLIHI